MTVAFLTLWKPTKPHFIKQELPEDLEKLERVIRNDISELMNQNLSLKNMRQSDLEKCQRNRNLLKHALQTCGYGDYKAKEYVKAYMLALLQRKYEITEEILEQYLPFEQFEKQSARDRFEILLYIYEKALGYEGNALEKLFEPEVLPAINEKAWMDGYVVTEQMIKELYMSQIIPLTLGDKIEILGRRIFSMNRGNGVIEELLYQKIDGISAGVSGKEDEVATVWIMMHGKTIHLPFLSFETEQELMRVCKKIYKFQAPGQLNQSKGYIVNRLKNGGRISDMRPPFASRWAFWIRMFDSVEKHSIKALFPQKNNELLQKLLYYIIRGEQTCVITGQQGSGKTTCLGALVEFINPTFNIRTIELTFELQLEKIYPKRNIAAMRETGSIKTEEALEFVKRTDADVVIFGEIVKETEGEKVIRLTQSGSRFSLSTHHGMTTKATVEWFRNALLKNSGFQNEKLAECQVADALRFDIHLEKNVWGERFISKITEIVPANEDAKRGYGTREILVFENNTYVMKQPISKEIQKRIMNKLTTEQVRDFSLMMEQATQMQRMEENEETEVNGLKDRKEEIERLEENEGKEGKT